MGKLSDDLVNTLAGLDDDARKVAIKVLGVDTVSSVEAFSKGSVWVAMIGCAIVGYFLGHII